jgi:hypothetical protein
MSSESGNVWKFLSRPTVVNELRDLIRDPAVMRQNPTDLCGPYSILMEFARRNPVRFVRGAAELLRSGVFTTSSGRKIVAADDLRERPIPEGDLVGAEWLYAATMRDSENVIDDVDDGEGIEGITWPFEIEEWIEDILGLKANYLPCFSDGELTAIRAGQRAVELGGMAILLVDKNLLKHEEGDTEEQMWWRRRLHHRGGKVDGFSRRSRCKDDDVPPDHYAVLLGSLRGASSDASEFSVRVWSFGHEYEITGNPNSFGEYLYAVITGVP